MNSIDFLIYNIIFPMFLGAGITSIFFVICIIYIHFKEGKKNDETK